MLWHDLFQVLAISTDSHHTHLAWLKTPRAVTTSAIVSCVDQNDARCLTGPCLQDSTFCVFAFGPKEGGLGELNYPLVADTSKRISKQYGVLVDDENGRLIRSYLAKAIEFLFLLPQTTCTALRCAACS